MVTVLVVDDDRVNCDMLHTVFTRKGYHVVTGTSGREALALFREHRPHVTLLDLRMPEMDGLRVLWEIRAIDPQAAVIILGGGATEEQENQARELRVTDFLRKGLSLDVLVNVVAQATQTPQRRFPPTSSVDHGGRFQEPKEKILVVEGEASVRDLLVRFLTLRGYHVHVASTGQEAMEAVATVAPHVMLLDMYLPDKNGVEVLRELRQSGYEGGVIALTGCQSEALLKDAWDLGLQEVLYKPVDLNRFLATLELVLVLQEC